jgi:uncharacterized membrane protein
MKILFRAIPWLILLASFAILAYFYNSLPGEILITRSFFGGESVMAQKTLFTVFRVPLIETVCAAAIEIMRRKFSAENAKFSLMWNILLYTVALKSLLQSLETISAENSASAFFYLTIAVVASGILAALFAGRGIFSKSSRAAGNFNLVDSAILIFLLFSYLGLAIVPILVYK